MTRFCTEKGSVYGFWYAQMWSVLLQESSALISHLDIVPTLLDWFGLSYPQYELNGQTASLTGAALMCFVFFFEKFVNRHEKCC